MALDAGGDCAATFLARAHDNRSTNRIFASSCDSSRRWRKPQLLAEGRDFVSAPRVVITGGGETLVLWARYLDTDYPARSELLVATHPPGEGRFGKPARLADGPIAVVAGGVPLVRSAATTLAAWAGSAGPTIVTRRDP